MSSGKTQAIALALVFATTNIAVGDPGYSIEDVVNSFDESGVKTTTVGYQYWFADKSLADGKTLKLSVVRPNAVTHEPHTRGRRVFLRTRGDRRVPSRG